jgi:hypothetical protein
VLAVGAALALLTPGRPNAEEKTPTAAEATPISLGALAPETGYSGNAGQSE